MDKYALLVRMNPRLWPGWKRHIQPGQDSQSWFKIGRRIPEEMHAGLRVVVLGTDRMGILAIGETISDVENRADPDSPEMALSEQTEYKEKRNLLIFVTARIVGSDDAPVK